MKLFAIPLSILLTLLCYISGYTQGIAELPLHVNLGSTSAYTSTTGTVYLPDQPWATDKPYGYIGGFSTYLDYASVGGTNDSLLYQIQRVNLDEYRVGQLNNGTYVIVLYFAELIAHGPQNTVFDVTIENQQVLDNFDLYEATDNNREYALARRFLTTVTDGQLNIRFNPTAGSQHLAAISVLPYTPDDIAPATPQGISAIQSYETVILKWHDVPEVDTDLEGYLIYRASNADGPYLRVTNELVPMPRYIDQFKDDAFSTMSITATMVITMPSDASWYYKLASVDLQGNESLQSEAISSQPLSVESTSLPTYHLEIPKSTLAQLSSDVNDNSRYQAKLAYEGAIYDVEVRYRGFFTRKAAKKSWKIVFKDDSPFLNRSHVDLKAHSYDSSMIRGMLATDIYAQLGIAPSLAKHALLFVNGEYFGVYTDYERVDENFLRRTGRNPGSTIYETLYNTRSNYGSFLKAAEYPLLYKLRTNEHLGFKPLATFLEIVNLVPDQFFPQTVERVFNIQNYMKYYAGIIFTSNLDFTRHNVFLVNDPETKQWEIIPWDHDLTFSVSDIGIDAGLAGGYPMVNGANILLTKMLAVPQYRAYYCSQLQNLADEEYIAREINPLLESYHESIKVAAHADWRKYGWENNNDFDESLEGLKQFVLKRGRFLRERFAGFCPTATSLITINEVATSSHTVTCDPDERNAFACRDQWIEIYNAGLEEVDLQGLYLTDDPAAPTRFRFDQSVPIPAGEHILIWADNEPWQGATHTTFNIEPSSTSISLVAEDGATILDQINLAERGHNIFIQRYPDGAKNEYVVESDEASPGFRNRLSAAILFVSTSPPEPEADQETMVSVSIFPEIEFIEGTLNYRINGQTVVLPLERSSYGQFSATIPAQPTSTHVEYYLTIKSYTGEEISPASAANNVGYYQYLVGYKRPLLKINEIRAIKDLGVLSWFEIYNDENVAVDLAGMYLSNDPADPRKYEIPANLRPIQPGGFTVFYANGTPDLSSQHTNFILDKEDGTIILSDRDNTFNQEVTNHSYTSIPDFGALQLCANNTSIWSPTQSPTPGYANSPDCQLIFVPSLVQ